MKRSGFTHPETLPWGPGGTSSASGGQRLCCHGSDGGTGTPHKAKRTKDRVAGGSCSLHEHVNRVGGEWAGAGPHRCSWPPHSAPKEPALADQPVSKPCERGRYSWTVCLCGGAARSAQSRVPATWAVGRAEAKFGSGSCVQPAKCCGASVASAPSACGLGLRNPRAATLGPVNQGT